MLELPPVKSKLQRGLESILKAVRGSKPQTLERAKEVIELVELIAEESLSGKGSVNA